MQEQAAPEDWAYGRDDSDDRARQVVAELDTQGDRDRRLAHGTAKGAQGPTLADRYSSLRQTVVSLEIEQGALHVGTIHTVLNQCGTIHGTISFTCHDTLDVANPFIRLAKAKKFRHQRLPAQCLHAIRTGQKAC